MEDSRFGWAAMDRRAAVSGVCVSWRWRWEKKECDVMTSLCDGPHHQWRRETGPAPVTLQASPLFQLLGGDGALSFHSLKHSLQVSPGSQVPNLRLCTCLRYPHGLELGEVESF